MKRDSDAPTQILPKNPNPNEYSICRDTGIAYTTLLKSSGELFIILCERVMDGKWVVYFEDGDIVSSKDISSLKKLLEFAYFHPELVFDYSVVHDNESTFYKLNESLRIRNKH